MLTSLRNQIDQTDKRITSLLLERYKIVKKIADIKRKNNILIEDREREKQIMEKLTSDPSLDDSQKTYILSILLKIHEVSKDVQKS